MKNKMNKKERGAGLIIVLALMVLHGIFAAILYYYTGKNDASVDHPMILILMSIHFLMNVVAAIGIWFWQKWAVYVFVASTIIAAVVGMVVMGIWSAFYSIIPLAILGWLLRAKWNYFEK